MAVKIRLARHGAKKRPYYRVVVADGRMPRDGRYIEQIGTYNPLTDPKTINIDVEKAEEWVGKGAQMSSAVSHLVAIAKGEAEVPAAKTKKSKKQLAREKEAAEAAESAEAEDSAAEDQGDASEDAAAPAEEAPAEEAAADEPAEEPAAEEAE